MPAMDIDVAYQNYDVVFKEFFSVFRNHSLDFLGLAHMAPIDRVLDSQLPALEAREGECDKLFQLKDDSILHLEDEAELSEADLRRFAGYDLAIYTKYDQPMRTVVIVHRAGKALCDSFDSGVMRYKVEVVDLSSMDGEAVYARLRAQVAAGEPVNPLELAYMPLMRNEAPPLVVAERAVELTAQAATLSREERRKLVAGILVLCVKFGDQGIIDEMLEASTMNENLKIFFQKVENIGMKKGIEQGLEQGLEQGREEGRAEGNRSAALAMLDGNEPLLKIQKYTQLPPETIRALAKERGVMVRK